MDWRLLRWLYRRIKTAWETILKRPVVAGRGVKADGTTEDVVIASEINNRVGPMAAWTAPAWRASNQRHAPLDCAPVNFMWKSWMSLRPSTGIYRPGSSRSQLREGPGSRVLGRGPLYIETIAERSRTLGNASAFIRRRRGGVKLVTAS